MEKITVKIEFAPESGKPILLVNLESVMEVNKVGLEKGQVVERLKKVVLKIEELEKPIIREFFSELPHPNVVVTLIVSKKQKASFWGAIKFDWGKEFVRDFEIELDLESHSTWNAFIP